MPEYQLQIKQVVDYPRCRIYRQFVHRLMADRSIRASGGSGLFYFTVLCSYANFRTSYRRIDGISYTIYPGEWVCTLKEVSQWFRTRFQCQALTVLEQLQKQHFITFQTLDRGNVIRYKICDWARHNTVLEYNAPCQKDTGFFFLPVSVVTDLISTSRCSEMDIILDLWVSAVYNDNQVQGSDLGPVVYFRNGTGNPLVAYTELAVRWGLSRATVGRVLKKLAALDYISLMSFPGRHGSVVYLKNYLSTMFEISDVMVDKEEVAMTLNIRLELPDESGSSQNTPSIEHEVIQQIQAAGYLAYLQLHAGIPGNLWCRQASCPHPGRSSAAAYQAGAGHHPGAKSSQGRQNGLFQTSGGIQAPFLQGIRPHPRMAQAGTGAIEALCGTAKAAGPRA